MTPHKGEINARRRPAVVAEPLRDTGPAARRRGDGAGQVGDEPQQQPGCAYGAGQGVQLPRQGRMDLAKGRQRRNQRDAQGDPRRPRRRPSGRHDQLLWMNGPGMGVEPTTAVDWYRLANDRAGLAGPDRITASPPRSWATSTSCDRSKTVEAIR